MTRPAAFFSFALCAFAAAAQAQPTELFFSEYVEGSSNNKALEIYNGTGAPRSLAGYNVQMFFNGSLTAGLTINLNAAAVVAPGDVYVLAQAAADPAILAVADQTNGSGWFNGDDAVVLRRGTAILDVIGQIGFRPVPEWGSGLASTLDNTLRRKMTVTAGDPIGSDPFVPAVEWDGFANNTFGGLGCHNGEETCVVLPPVDATIPEIQGAGLASPLAGARVRTEGNVVTAVFANGFFIQTPSADADPETSEGVFVFTGVTPPPSSVVAVGDVVDLAGKAVEFFQMTEIEADLEDVDVVGSGQPVPAPVAFGAALPSPMQPQPATEMERFEGMLVRVEGGVVSSPSNEFAEASVVAGGARAFREPGILYPGLPGLPVWDGNPEIFEIDTDLFAASPGLRLAGGSTVTAEGPLAFSFGDYQVWPTALVVDGAPAVRPVRAKAAGEFTIGTQNMLRLCDTTADECADVTPTQAEYEARLRKLSLHVREALRTPDVLAVQEVETLAVLSDLAGQVNADDPDAGYTAHLLEGNDVGGIDVGFLVRGNVRVDSLTQFGKDDIFPLDGSLLNDRPPLVLRGAYLGSGGVFPFVVINVHQRSLSGIEGNSASAQRVRAKRHEQARRLSLFIDALQDAEPGLRLVVIGDFNAFEFTDGYVDVMGQVTGNPDPLGALVPATDEIDLDLTNRTLVMPAGERYSFVFDGTAQSLDHALTSQALDPLVAGVEHARGNADAPLAFAGDETTPLRSSDHDATVVFVNTDSDGDGVPEDQDACAGTVVPEAVPTVRLNPGHYALVDGDGVFDTAGNGPGDAFTLADTAGCSCGQILDALQMGHGQYKFGCTVETMRTWVSALP